MVFLHTLLRQIDVVIPHSSLSESNRVQGYYIAIETLNRDEYGTYHKRYRLRMMDYNHLLRIMLLNSPTQTPSDERGMNPFLQTHSRPEPLSSQIPLRQAPPITLQPLGLT